MVTTRTLLVAAGMSTVLAAGTGGYLVLRHNRMAPQPTTPAEVVPWTTAEIGAPVPKPDETAAPAKPAATVPATTEPRESRPAPRPRPEPQTQSPAPVVETPAPPPSAPAQQSTTTPTPPPPPSAPAAVQTTAPSVPDLSPAPSPVVEAPKEQEPPRLEELTIKEDSVIGIRLETLVTTETAKIEDRVLASVTRDVMVDGRTAVPTGARLEGVVSQVETGGKFKGRSRVGIRFTQLVLSDNHRIPIKTETIFRDGDAPGGEATAKIGASAVVGAIIGSVIGGKKGAAIGAGAGAAGGTAVVAKGGRNDAVIPAGTLLTVRLTAPVKVTIEKTDGRPPTG